MQIIPIEDAKTFVNGKLINEAVTLQSGKVICSCGFTIITFKWKNILIIFLGDRIIMGESHIFRFNNPQQGEFKVFFFPFHYIFSRVFGLMCSLIIS